MINKNLLFNLFLVIIPIIGYLSIIHAGYLKIQLFLAHFCAGAMGFIFTLSVFILHLNLSKKPEEFVMRYLVMTTVQMLSFLAIVSAFVYTGKPTVIVYHSLSLFGVLLVFQSAGLLLRRK